ncbi:MAG: alcohol dehydrogenase catalytic domain-containing protein [Sphingomonadaceae bacterium]|nr:alcohol dehydrogenase catalytic domain-containing protein [Sphingomonadaceae bacterium]
MEFAEPGSPLRLIERDIRDPGKREILVEVGACGVCRTDLHIVDGDIQGKLPIVPGHEIVGRVSMVGEGAEGFAIGDRVGIPWLGHSCGKCPYCRSDRENLCNDPLFTGFTRDGGFATHALADARYCFPIPARYGDAEAAPRSAWTWVSPIS